jgi:DinB family protein
METTRAALIKRLQETGDIFLAGVSGVTETQAKFKPAANRWSIEECAEHIALVENGLLLRLSQQATPSDRVERPERQAELGKLGADRATKRQAPEAVRPTGRFGSLAGALEQFVANRERTMMYLRQCQDDLHARTVVHPIGLMTCHELVVLMSAHTLRHLDQIREIQRTAAYPR